MITVSASTLVDDYEHIFSQDPAIEKVEDLADRHQRYVDTGDVSHLPIRSGQKPAVFKMRHLRGSARRVLIDAVRVHDGVNMQVLGLCFRLTVRAMLDSAGQEQKFAVEHDAKCGLPLLSENVFNQLDEIDDLVNELGFRAIAELGLKKKQSPV